MKIADMRRKPKPPYVYVGRAMPFQKIEPSPLGNPFKLSSGEKIEDVLLKYRQWLFSKIKDKDRSVMALLESMNDDSVLACWCCEKEGDKIFTDREICHAQVIFKAARYLAGFVPATAKIA